MISARPKLSKPTILIMNFNNSSKMLVNNDYIIAKTGSLSHNVLNFKPDFTGSQMILIV